MNRSLRLERLEAQLLIVIAIDIWNHYLHIARVLECFFFRDQVWFEWFPSFSRLTHGTTKLEIAPCFRGMYLSSVIRTSFYTIQTPELMTAITIMKSNAVTKLPGNFKIKCLLQSSSAFLFCRLFTNFLVAFFFPIISS